MMKGNEEELIILPILHSLCNELLPMSNLIKYYNHHINEFSIELACRAPWGLGHSTEKLGGLVSHCHHS